jgi:hypothetical protein
MDDSNPRVVVLGSRKGRFRADSPGEKELILNAHEAWAYAFGCDYINIFSAKLSDLENYDLAIFNSEYKEEKYLFKLQELINKRPATTKAAILIEGLASYYIKPQFITRELFDSADLIININRHTTSFFAALTKTKVEYIGVPYPVDVISRYRIPIEKRNRRVFICPFLLDRWNDYHVAREIGLPYYGYEKRISRTIKSLLKNKGKQQLLNPNYRMDKAKSVYNDPKLEVIKNVSIFDFFNQNNNSYIWVNLDDRYTWGRYVLDAAALNIPIITTKSTGHGEDLFPETTLDNEFIIDEAIEIGQRLARDEDFYRYVAEYPNGRMEHLKPEAMKNKLLSIMF